TIFSRPRFVCCKQLKNLHSSTPVPQLRQKLIDIACTGEIFARHFWHVIFGTILILWTRTPCNKPPDWFWENMISLRLLRWIRREIEEEKLFRMFGGFSVRTGHDRNMNWFIRCGGMDFCTTW